MKGENDGFPAAAAAFGENKDSKKNIGNGNKGNLIYYQPYK